MTCIKVESILDIFRTNGDFSKDSIKSLTNNSLLIIHILMIGTHL